MPSRCRHRCSARVGFAPWAALAPAVAVAIAAAPAPATSAAADPPARTVGPPADAAGIRLLEHARPGDGDEIPGVRERTGRLIVAPHRGVEVRARARVLPLVLHEHPEVGELVVRVPPGLDERAFEHELRATGDYRYVEPDWLVFATDLPDDPLFPGQHHHGVIGSAAAWGLETGDPAVVVAICDSGIDLDHPDLAVALVPGYNAVDDLPQADGGAVDALTDHGTQVAGVVGAAGDNGEGVTGVAWNVGLMPIRVRNVPDDAAFISDINAGARWAVDHGATIVNASFSAVESASVQETGAYVRAAGGSYVWSAGNAARSLGAIDHPDVLIVGATDDADGAAAFSNFGRGIDLVAPGVDVLTTRIDDYGPISGTSFSAPMAAGALALVRSVDPTFPPRAAEAILLATAVDLGERGEDDRFGAGRLDLAAAVALAVAARDADVAPLAFDDAVAAITEGPIVIDVLANDVELDGQSLEIIGFDPVTPGGGTVRLEDDHLVLVPAAGFEGTDLFGYTIADPTGNQATATVRVDRAIAPPFAAAVPVVTVTVFGIVEQLVNGDFDGDGDSDVVAVTSGFTPFVVFEQTAPGSLSFAGVHATDQFDTPHAAVADMDGDGRDDLVHVHFLVGRVGISRSTGASGFDPPQWKSVPSPRGIAVLDLDDDGTPDVAVGTLSPATIRLLLQQSDGSLVEGGNIPLPESPTRLGAADMNGDDVVDLVAVGGGRIMVVLRDAAGSVIEILAADVGFPAGALELVDFDGDGDTDAVLLSSGVFGVPGVSVMANDGTGTLAGSTSVPAFGAFPASMAVADLEADGDVDVVQGHLSAPGLGVHPAASPGSIPLAAESLSPHPLSAGVRAVIALDLDGDGDRDLVAAPVVSGPLQIAILENLADPPPDPDVDGDGIVGFGDLLLVLSAWGPCGTGCPTDLDENGVTDFDDLLVLLAAWS